MEAQVQSKLPSIEVGTRAPVQSKLPSIENESTSNNQFPANLPVFKRGHYDRWCTQMNVIFRF